MNASLSANRDFRLLWLGGLLAAFGSQMAALALPLVVLAETGSPAKAGLVGTASAVALLITVLPGGAIADAAERWRLMLYCDSGAALVAGVLAVSVVRGSPSLALILTAAVLGPVLSAFYGPAASALLKAAVPAPQLGIAMSRLQARSAAARLVGPLVGGALFGLSHGLPFLVECGGLLSSAGCLLAVRARAVPARRAKKMLHPKELGAGLAFIWRQPYLRASLVLFGTGLNAAFGGLMFAALARGAQLDPSGRSSGLVVALAGAGTLAGALLAPRLKAHEHPRATILFACWTCTGASALLVVTHNAFAMGSLIAVSLLVAAVGNVGFATTMLLLTPSELVGRVQSAGGFVSMAVQPLGPLAGGLLLGRFGPRLTFAILAGVVLCGAVAATLSRGLHVDIDQLEPAAV